MFSSSSLFHTTILSPLMMCLCFMLNAPRCWFWAAVAAGACGHAQYYTGYQRTAIKGSHNSPTQPKNRRGHVFAVPQTGCSEDTGYYFYALDGKAIVKPQPAYTPKPDAKNAWGKVWVFLRVKVSREGKVVSVELSPKPQDSYRDIAPLPRSDDPILNNLAVQAAYQAQFAPLKGEKCPAQYEGTLSYTVSLPQSLPDLAIRLVSPKGERKDLEPTEDDPMVRTTRVQIQANESVASLLKKDGLTVNANALMLVQILNSDINYHTLPPRSWITLPTTVGSPRLDDAKKNGSSIEIVLYPKLRSELRSEAKQIRVGWCNPYYANAELLVDMKRIEAAVQKLLRDDIPVTIKTLNYLKDVLTYESRELEGPCGADVESKSGSPITSIADEVEPVASSVQNAQSTDVRVAVSTVGQDGRPYNNLVVFARAPFTGLVQRFRNLSSPAADSLSVADYFVWAEGFSHKCETIEVKVRPTEVLSVTLKCQ
jgi:hypothetical protein